MPFEIKPCPTSEFVRVVEVEARGFKIHPFSTFLFPGPFPENRAELRAQEMIRELEADPAGRWLKVVDTDAENPDEGISYAKWQIYKDTLPGPRQIRRYGQGCNVEACIEFFGGLRDKRQEYVGDKHCLFLQVLATDPSYARRGAGGMLVKWGTDQADEYGIPIYLESSEVARNLYSKCGFETREVFEVDFSRFGETEPQRVWLMMYGPKVKEPS